ncbi:UNVERIFIED_CONTAM: hypothetical protein FKN15_070344 [Acipenser sinensis]
MKVEIDKLAAEYIANVRNLPSEQRVEHLEKIQTAYSKCKEYSDDKVQLAMQTYEMVDKHIRRLDADLARFEADLKEKLEVSGYESPEGRGIKSECVGWGTAVHKKHKLMKPHILAGKITTSALQCSNTKCNFT